MNAGGVILLLEDELPAARKASGLIARFAPGAEVVHLRSVAAARRWLAEAAEPPRLIFSDIELLDGSAFELFAVAPPGAPIVFLTAHATFRAEAFATDGVAYLVKPYSEDDFAAAWGKVARLVGEADAGGLAALPPLTSRRGTRVSLVPVGSVAYFVSERDFVVAVDRAGRRHPLAETLAQLEARLPAETHFRLSRAAIVARDAVEAFVPFRKNRLTVRLRWPAGEELHTSNARGPAFRRWLEGG